MAGSTSFGRKASAAAPAPGYRPLPRLPEPPGAGGFLRLPALRDPPPPANDAAPADWRNTPLPQIPSEPEADSRFVDEIDFETWKSRRKIQRRMPWRQISLMAALSFGIGSFVLPGDINAIVRPVLWALSGLALASGFLPARKS